MLYIGGRSAYVHANEMRVASVVSMYVFVPVKFRIVPFFYQHFYFSSLTRRRFYPQRSSGQTVVAGVVPSPPPVRAFCFLSRIGFIQHSHCLSIFIECSYNSRSCAFRLSIFHARKSPYECTLGETRTHEIGIDRGTRTTCQATGDA